VVTFGPESSEFTLLTLAVSTFFGDMTKNWHITQNISEYTGSILTYFTGLVGVLVGMIIQIFVWRRAQGTLLSQPAKFGRCLQTSRGTTFTLCFGIQQWIG